MREAYKLEIILAHLLKNGTTIASAIIAMGFLLPAEGTAIVTGGIALFILLPVLRVGLMLVVFIRERDRHFIVISIAVLLIILTSFTLGIVLPKVPSL